MNRQQEPDTLAQPLRNALKAGDTKTALALVHAGADPNTHIQPTSRPSLKRLLTSRLRRSPPSANTNLTAFLLACGAGWYPARDTAVPLIVLEEDLSLLRAMLAHGADVHTRAADTLTALHYAVLMERVDTAQLLLASGADVNAPDKEGKTPLMMAVWNTTLKEAHLLISQGANPNVQDAKGWTALHYAITSPLAESIIPELLAKGADLNVCNKQGETPLQLARSYEHSDAVRFLTREGQ